MCIINHFVVQAEINVKGSYQNTKRVGRNVEVGIENWYRGGSHWRALSHYSSRESIWALGKVAKDNQMGLLKITEKFQACRVEIILRKRQDIIETKFHRKDNSWLLLYSAETLFLLIS